MCIRDRVSRCNEEKSLERSIDRVEIRESLGGCFSSTEHSGSDTLEGEKGEKKLGSED